MTLILKLDLYIMATYMNAKIEVSKSKVHKLWFRNTENFQLFDEHDLDFEPASLILKLDLDMVVAYYQTKIRSVGQRVKRLQLRNTKTLCGCDLDLDPVTLIKRVHKNEVRQPKGSKVMKI